MTAVPDYWIKARFGNGVNKSERCPGSVRKAPADHVCPGCGQRRLVRASGHFQVHVRRVDRDPSGDWDMHALDAGYEEFPHDE